MPDMTLVEGVRTGSNRGGESAPLVVTELERCECALGSEDETGETHEKDAETGEDGDGVEERLPDEPVLRGRICHGFIYWGMVGVQEQA